MPPSEIVEKLNSIGQSHLLDYWDTLKPIQKEQLKAQIDSLDAVLFRQQQASLLKQKSIAQNTLTPLQRYAEAGNREDKIKGREIISQGQCGCLLIAGGQGTRLCFDGPKGMFPLTSIKHKTLYQLFAEKTLAAGHQVNGMLPLAIMTSPSTHQATLQYFEEHRYFGLSQNQVFFFSQSTLPLLNDSGNLFLEGQDWIASGPDGNGSSLKCFVESGIWHQWHNKGVRYLTYALIDNPLADPFDAELIGFHARMGSDVVIKSTNRLNIEEKTGILTEKEGRIQVVEYSELSEEERGATLADGSLKHPCANLSLFSFQMDFIKEAADRFFDKMPFHLAHKAAKYIDSQGIIRQSDRPIAWKFEKFIFDVLPFTDKVTVLKYPRGYCFAPLKNREGVDSPATVQAALQDLDRITIAAITGIEPPSTQFELSQEFYYPSHELLQQWKNRPFPKQEYITP